MDTRLAPQRTIAMRPRVLSIDGFIGVDGNSRGNGPLGVGPAAAGVAPGVASGCSPLGRLRRLAG